MYPKMIYSSPFFIAALFILIVALAAYRRRKIRGAWYLALVCLSGAVWAAFEGMLYLGLGIDADMLLTYAQYLGAAPLVTLALCFSLTVFGFEHWINRKTTVILVLMPLAILVSAWTDPLHHLVYKDYYLIGSNPIPIRAIERGPLWWGIIGCQYLQALALTVLLAYIVATSTRVLRAQASIILAAVGIVWGINGIYVTGNSPMPHMDISPLAFILVAISMAWGFFRYHLLDLSPVAKAEIFQGISDPILVIDNNHTLMELNPAAEALFNIRASAAIGRSILPLMEGRAERDTASGEYPDQLVRLWHNGEEHPFEIHTTPLQGKEHTPMGHIIIFRDITARQNAERAERHNERLQGVIEMAGAVCHDMNQPVMAMMGYAELMRMRIPKENPLFMQTAKLAEQAERLSEISKKLMNITRYATKEHQGHQIIDIDVASSKKEKQIDP